MQVDEIINKINNIVSDLEALIETTQDAIRRKFLTNLKTLFVFSIYILQISSCKEFCKDSNNVELNYKNKENKIITTTLKFSYVDKTLRRFLIFAAWGWFELFFSEKVNSRDKASLLVTKYFRTKNCIKPDIIDFFRETRNALHGNGIYGTNKKQMQCSIENKIYALSPGKEIEWATWPNLLSLIQESLKVL